MFQVRICLSSTFCSDYARFSNEMQAMKAHDDAVSINRSINLIIDISLIVAALLGGICLWNYRKYLCLCLYCENL